MRIYCPNCPRSFPPEKMIDRKCPYCGSSLDQDVCQTEPGQEIQTRCEYCGSSLAVLQGELTECPNCREMAQGTASLVAATSADAPPPVPTVTGRPRQRPINAVRYPWLIAVSVLGTAALFAVANVFWFAPNYTFAGVSLGDRLDDLDLSWMEQEGRIRYVEDRIREDGRTKKLHVFEWKPNVPPPWQKAAVTVVDGRVTGIGGRSSYQPNNVWSQVVDDFTTRFGRPDGSHTWQRSSGTEVLYWGDVQINREASLDPISNVTGPAVVLIKRESQGTTDLEFRISDGICAVP